MGMNVNQLHGIAKEIDINITKEIDRHDLQKQIIWRLEWLGMSPVQKAGDAKPWCPPVDEMIIKSPKTMKDDQIKTDTLNYLPSNTNLTISFLKQELETLRAENDDLKSGLRKSESLRKEMEGKFAERRFKVDNKELLEKVWAWNGTGV